MPPAMPLVSVLMPFFNSERTLAQAFESVAAQTHRPIEVIAVDDGSTDGGLALMERLAAAADFPVRVEHQANAGPSPALHRALSLAQGDWVCWLAADDWYSPHFVSKCLAEAARFGDEDIILHSNAWLVEADGKVTGTADAIEARKPLQGDAFDDWIEGRGRMYPSTMFIRRELLLRAGGFEPTVRAEDIDLFPRLARTAPFHYIAEPIFHSRHTPGSLGRKPWVWGEEVVRALNLHADILGSRLPGLLARSTANISAACFEYGRPLEGLRWAVRSMRYARGPSGKFAAATRSAWKGLRGSARFAAVRLFGRQRLVALKRKIRGGAPGPARTDTP